MQRILELTLKCYGGDVLALEAAAYIGVTTGEAHLAKLRVFISKSSVRRRPFAIHPKQGFRRYSRALDRRLDLRTKAIVT